MSSDYGIRHRLVARWKALDSGVTDREINDIIDYFVCCGTRMNDDFLLALLGHQNVRGGPFPGTRITEALNDEIFRARLDALERSVKGFQVPVLPGLGLELGYRPGGGGEGEGEATTDYPHFPILMAEGERSWSWREFTLTNREVCMVNAVEMFTNKPGWWVDCRDPDICEAWKQDMLKMDWLQIVPLKHADFTPCMADAVVQEMRVKAPFFEETGLVPVMDLTACVVKSDAILTEELMRALRDTVHPLEDVPDSEKDWRQGSDKKVLDLVDPSLWPLVYGKTRFVPGKHISREKALEDCGVGVTICKPLKIERIGVNHSNNFQWLPCDVSISSDGQASIDSYINNLHPTRHSEIYEVIEKFIEISLPAWDLIYRWPKDGGCNNRVDVISVVRTCKTKLICGPAARCDASNRPLEPGEPERDNHPDMTRTTRQEHHLPMAPQRQKDLEWFAQTHPVEIPEPEFDELRWKLSPLEICRAGFLSSASRIQVIVKLTNIYLTPESPAYDGSGSWHLEGTFNEHICATALYYYDIENVTGGQLDFRTRGNDQDLKWVVSHDRRDPEPLEQVFSLSNGLFSTVQTIGSVQTPGGRAVFYPNVYQRRVAPLKLADPTRPGHCKTLALFLVDPKIPIISTANVGPQQRHWWEETTRFGSQVLAKLPAELQEMVLENADPLMHLEQAKIMRVSLTNERRAENTCMNAGIECERF